MPPFLIISSYAERLWSAICCVYCSLLKVFASSESGSYLIVVWSEMKTLFKVCNDEIAATKRITQTIWMLCLEMVVIEDRSGASMVLAGG